MRGFSNLVLSFLLLNIDMLLYFQHRSNLDMNVKPVWELGITGKNAVISILDDGMIIVY